MNVNVDRNHFRTQFIPNFKNYCRKIIPFAYFYKKKNDSYNWTAHELLIKEVSLILPNFPNDIIEKRSTIASLVTSFIGLVDEDMSSYLYNKKQKALHKAFVAMENKANLQQQQKFIWKILWSCTIFIVRYFRKINTVHKMHNTITWNGKIFASKLNHWFHWYLSKDGIGHYAINSLILNNIKEKNMLQCMKSLSVSFECMPR